MPAHKSPVSAVWSSLRGGLVVSCQAREDEPFRDPGSMARFAQSAVLGGARGIRAQGAEDVRAIRGVVSVPILGIRKIPHVDGAPLITPTVEAAAELVEAGADLVAVDCTVRGQRAGALGRVAAIKARLGVPVFADIATLDEARAAADAGADAVLSTMRGYTAETAAQRELDLDFIGALAEAMSVPVIAEGHVRTPQQARAAIDRGAFAVVVGTAITRPIEIARWFVDALEGVTS